MAENKANYKVGFNNTGSTTVTFDGRCYSYEIYSNDDAIYVEEDGDATVNSYRIPEDTTSERLIPCRTLGVRGVSGSGLAEIKIVPMENWAITDQEVMNTRAPAR